MQDTGSDVGSFDGFYHREVPAGLRHALATGGNSCALSNEMAGIPYLHLANGSDYM